MSYRLEITLHLWWLAAYLAVGAVSYVPFNWLASRSIASARPFWRDLWTATKHQRFAPLLKQVFLWPAALYEVLVVW